MVETPPDEGERESSRWNALGRLRARRSRAAEPRSYRLANSIRLPWGVGFISFLVVAVAIALLVGSTDDDAMPVPPALLDFQESGARATAQSTRRSLNEGVADLDELGRVVGALESRTPEVERALRAFHVVHQRYTSVYALDDSGRVVARVGQPPAPELLRPKPPYARPGMQDAKPGTLAGSPVIQQYAPVRGGRTPARVVVGHYNPDFLRFPLDAARPGEGWIVNSRGQVVGSVGDPPRFGQLPRRELRESASRAVGGLTGARSAGGSLDRQELVGFSPVSGLGPGGRLRWGLVTTRAVKTFTLPQTTARREAVLGGVLLGVLTLFVFGWLYIVVLAPVMRLQREAERLAYGDLSKNVQVVRYDEIGLIARALERMRIVMIRRQVQRSGRRRAGS